MTVPAENVSMRRHVVGMVTELPPGSRRIVMADGRSIGVFNIDGRFYALRNRCPHQGAPLCEGRVKGTTLPGRPYEYTYGRDREIIQCPWHGWEFEITTGRTYFNPHRMRVKTYDVTVERSGAGRSGGEPEEDVVLETFEVTTEGDLVVLHA